MIDRRLLPSARLAARTVAALRGVRADIYPSRNVRVVVPFSAGGTTDFAARLVAERMSALAGQAFVVENRTGGPGMVGLPWGDIIRSAGVTLPPQYVCVMASRAPPRIDRPRSAS